MILSIKPLEVLLLAQSLVFPVYQNSLTKGGIPARGALLASVFATSAFTVTGAMGEYYKNHTTPQPDQMGEGRRLPGFLVDTVDPFAARIKALKERS